MALADASAATGETRRRISRVLLFRVFIRSLLIQVGFNTKVMQGLGFAYAVYPALKSLYPAGEARTAAVRRHLGLFNTHPYFAAAIIGGVLQLEERVAAGTATPQEVKNFRDALAAPLAAIGDAFFWDALRPACALLAVLTAPTLGLWALAVFLGVYNITHLSIRIWLYVVGYRKAEGLIAPIGRARFPVNTAFVRQLAAVLAGAVAAQVAVVAGRQAGAGSPGSFLVATSAALGAVWLAPRVSPFTLTYGALALALLGGLFSSH
jgi:PTS system mannose-specific IID component